MGSSYFGIPSMRSEKSSSRKNKKSTLDKPKQPQRGLGVAQLEQIRLRTQMACGFNNPPLVNNQEDIMGMQGVLPYGTMPQSSTSYPNYSQSSPSTSSTYGHHPNFTMSFGEENMRYQDSQSSSTVGCYS
ncbi:protein SPEAR3-like [Silene latifolia]|uniref:protein SPEAR3-like n=1 Tax=Silene latifolia TaxID=37657 RepID=UPI003D76F90F